MKVTVNGAARRLDAGTTVATLVAAETTERMKRHTAVARNGEIVPRSAWPRTPLDDGDRVELVTAVQGG